MLNKSIIYKNKRHRPLSQIAKLNLALKHVLGYLVLVGDGEGVRLIQIKSNQLNMLNGIYDI